MGVQGLICYSATIYPITISPPHHYLSFFHNLHPINTSINTTPGSQTQ